MSVQITIGDLDARSSGGIESRDVWFARSLRARPDIVPAGRRRVGYSEQRIENNRFWVTFAGNDCTKADTVQQYLLYRAAELTLDYGYDYFTMVDRNLDRSTRYSGSSSTSGIPGYITEDGDYVGGLSSSSYSADPIDRYTAYADMVMFKGQKPASDIHAYDAQRAASVVPERHPSAGSDAPHPRTAVVATADLQAVAIQTGPAICRSGRRCEVGRRDRVLRRRHQHARATLPNGEPSTHGLISAFQSPASARLKYASARRFGRLFLAALSVALPQLQPQALSQWQAARPAPEGEGRPAPQAALRLLPGQPADADGRGDQAAVPGDPGMVQLLPLCGGQAQVRRPGPPHLADHLQMGQTPPPQEEPALGSQPLHGVDQGRGWDLWDGRNRLPRHNETRVSRFVKVSRSLKNPRVYGRDVIRCAGVGKP